jgi:hypothetical protein
MRSRVTDCGDRRRWFGYFTELEEGVDACALGGQLDGDGLIGDIQDLTR